MSNTNGFQGSYANERPPSSTGSGDADVASDPATSGFFSNDYKNDPASSGIFSNDLKKHEDLKTMLDSNKDNLKLEAMKRIIGMVAKGKDASDLFPAVVKNVVSKNIEVKKLVYVYLTRYAEEQQDLALLSISTFQRALKDPNQLIRASALRVLSSIRVPMIAPIMMLAIKEAVMDMSPYVRKTAAHAIPKLFSLDPEQKETMIEVIEKLLADKTTLVAGSAIQAFEEVCPDRIDLIHKNYRKLCNLLVDVEEWGQVVIINMLTRYCRTQFLNPNQHELPDEVEKKFYESTEDEEDEAKEEESAEVKKKPYVMDPDHRLLLRTCKPLLNSRNAAVVMAVAQLYHHCAPKTEVGLVAKALVRLLRGHKEVQFVVLGNIATMTIKRKGMFEPYLKSFYVRPNDPTHVKLLKLEILTNLATETSISTILREFQTYVSSSDKEFAAATIHAIGRCASSIAEITDTCLNGLVSLMSNRDECVVGESVVVIKKLLQMEPNEHKEIIVHMAKLVDKITVPMARASILWLIGEYSDRVPKIAPDVLRKMAKSFINEEDIVKLQVLNLAAKLCITNSKQTKLLCQYAFNLAKYDQNYDIRDRARFLRQLILPGEKASAFAKHAKKIFLTTKPAPVLQSKYLDRDQYQLGTLSHLINTRTMGYQELPDWPTESPDPSVRNVDVVMPWTESKFTKKKDKKKSFYSESESSGEDDSDEESSSEDTSADSSSSVAASSGSDSGSDSDDDADVDDDPSPKKTKVKAADVKVIKQAIIKVDKAASSDEDMSTDSSEESDTEGSTSTEDSSEEEVKKPPVRSKKSPKKASEPKKASAMLLDLDDFGAAPSSSSISAEIGNSAVLMPTLAEDFKNLSTKTSAGPSQHMINSSPVVPSKSYELLNRITGNGLGAIYKFTRSMSIYSPKMVSVEVTFTNHSDAVIKDIRMGDKRLQSGMSLHEFQQIGVLAVNASSSVIMGVDFCDTTQPALFDVCTQGRKYGVKIVAPVGELAQPTTLSESDFNALQGKLRGMNENTASVNVSTDNQDPQVVCQRVLETANVLQVPSSEDNTFKFAAKTLSTKADLLVCVKLKDGKASITVNCEKMVIGSMLVKDIKTALTR